MSAFQQMVVSGRPTKEHLKFHVGPCTSCGAPIFKARTGKGKLMPIDAEPSELGNIDIQRTRRGLSATVVKREPLFDEPRQLYTSHFATCPTADKHRRKR